MRLARRCKHVVGRVWLSLVNLVGTKTAEILRIFVQGKLHRLNPNAPHQAPLVGVSVAECLKAGVSANIISC